MTTTTCAVSFATTHSLLTLHRRHVIETASSSSWKCKAKPSSRPVLGSQFLSTETDCQPILPECAAICYCACYMAVMNFYRSKAFSAGMLSRHGMMQDFSTCCFR